MNTRIYQPLTESQEISINKILKIWREHGQDINDLGWPAHPEFVFRLRGEWKGWAYLLSDQPTPEDIAKNTEQDLVETIAFDRLVAVLGEQG